MPNGRMMVLGTRYHPLDLYNWLMTEDPDFKNSTSLILAIANGKSQLPQMYSMKELDRLSVSMGGIFFDSQFMMSTASMTGDIFDF